MTQFTDKTIRHARKALEKSGWSYVTTMGENTQHHRLYFVKAKPLAKFVLDKDTIGSHSFQRAIGIV